MRSSPIAGLFDARASDDRAIDCMPMRLIVRSEGLWAHVSSALV